MTADPATAAWPTGWAARIEARTPKRRDRTVDALRAMAIVGVVLGHWLVTAVVGDPNQPSALHGASALSSAPGLTPLTWLLELLGPLFFAGGYAATRGSSGRKPLPWLVSRASRLLTPVLVLAAVWLPATLLLTTVGAPAGTRQLAVTLVTQPLWFLLVYLVLTALTPIFRAAIVRYGLWSVLPALALVALTDLLRPVGLPTWLALLTTPVAWSVPYQLGIALAEGRLGRRAGWVLLPLGVVGGALLVLLARYPASAVGVPGQRWSNLDPPSLFALALVAAQLGAFLLLRPWLARLLRRPVVWAPVAVLNLMAMTVYCWHQSALLLVTFTGLLAGRPPGLLDTPDGAWPWHRLVLLPLFLLALAGLTALFHRFETGRPLSRLAGRLSRPAERGGRVIG